MGMEVVGFEIAQPPVAFKTEGDSSLLHEKANGKLSSEPMINVPIKFGTHGDDEPVKEVEATKNVSEPDTPKDAVDEWPAPKRIHQFYLVKYRPFEDPKLKDRTDRADKEIHKLNGDRFKITDGLKAKRVERSHVISQLKALNSEDKQFRGVIDGKRKEMEPLHQALGKLRGNRGDRGGIYSSEEELDAHIHSLHYRMQHESIPLSEEKQILKDIKQLEQTRDQVIANAAIRTKIQESLGKKESIQDQVKVIGGDLDGVRKDHQSVKSKKKVLEEELKVIDDGISALQIQLDVISEKRDKAQANYQQVRKQRDEGNSHFYQNRMLLNNARDLASKRDVKALEELSNAEVEKFMSLWSGSKGFRDDYEKRILGSLDYRQLSRDGRMRNPDEKPLVVIEAPAPPVQTEVLPKPNKKQPKEDPKPTPPKNKEEVIKKPKELGIDALEEDKESIISEPQKVAPIKKEVDEAKSKEMKLQEEKEKAKLALERKKKLAEKNAVKAANRAQKEAEKKLKDREKKAKKKAAASEPAEDSTEAESEVAEPEITKTASEPPAKYKEQKESNGARYRNRSKAVDSHPKAILKRKKSNNYWIYAAPAVLVVLILLALGYYRFFI